MKYKVIAKNWHLWIEAVDPDATMTKEEFDSLSIKEKIQIQIDCFGEENEL